tara:strand:- start:2188 stop:2304 length:117 start_codon:yes stop_codon:yes gene_type:complete
MYLPYKFGGAKVVVYFMSFNKKCVKLKWLIPRKASSCK